MRSPTAQVVILAVAFLFFIAIFLCIQGFPQFGGNPSRSKVLGNLVVSNIVLINPRNLAHQHDNCMHGQIAGLRFPICTYTAQEDPVVSKFIQEGKYWEPERVNEIIKLMEKHQTSIFVDIGTNVGAYSLAVAHYGRKVISIEPNMLTMKHLATSVVRGNVSDRITLLQNAVSNERETLHLGVDLRNRGDSYVLGADFCNNNPNNSHCLTPPVRTITLDDLLSVMPPGRDWKIVIKADAQGSEMKIFDPKTASKFFRTVNVIAMQVEWDIIGRQHSKDLEKSRQCDKVLTFLYSQNFSAYQVYPVVRSKSLNRASWPSWPYDVMFIKAN